MPYQKNSFANRIRTAIHELAHAGATCTCEAISIKARLMERSDDKRMLCALRDMVRAGELVKVSPGVYALDQKKNTAPELRQVMWRILRMRRQVTADDLVEMAGASPAYAAEWLRTLAKHGVVRLSGDNSYRLLQDLVEMPELTDNADKLQHLRQKKKQAALAALDQAGKAIAQAQAAINEL